MATETLTNQELFHKLLQVIESQAEKTREDISNEIKCESRKLLEKIENQDLEIKNLKEAHQLLEERCVQLERSIRKNNILVFGLLPPTDNTEILERTIDKIEESLEVKINPSEINNIYQLNSIKGAPIKIEFASYLKKISILKNCHKLKNTKIFIAHDLCTEDREKLKILQENLKQARAKNLTAVIRGNYLVVNGDKIHVNQLSAETSVCYGTIVNRSTRAGANIGTENSPELHLVKRKKNYERSNSSSSETSSKPVTRSTLKV